MYDVLLLNNDPQRIISKQLYKLKKYSLSGNTGNRKNIEKLARCVAKIHVQNVNQENFKKYNSQWIIEQVNKIKDNEYKDDIIKAVRTMTQIEAHNAPLKDYNFSAWDITQSNWQKDYQSGRIGKCAWDLSCIINCANNAQFSEIFLENYLRYGGEKPNLTALYANLYYVKVFEAIKKNDFENLMKITKEILDDTMFSTDLISYETLLKLNIIGY